MSGQDTNPANEPQDAAVNDAIQKTPANGTSTTKKGDKPAVNSARLARPKGGRGMGGGGMGMPAEKAMDFSGSLKRVLGQLRPERAKIAIVTALAVVSVTLAVIGPKLLGNATNVIFDGVAGKMVGGMLTKQGLPLSTPMSTITGAMEKAGGAEAKMAEMLRGMDIVPGQGIDFDKLGEIILAVVAVYAASFLFAWLQARITTGIVQRSIYRLRQDVETKINSLPLSYFDKQQRGEVLSRVTNDMDNISQTMQQTLSQLVTSVLTVFGVLGMMFYLSWELALVALVTVPLTVWVTMKIAKSSQPQFIKQWAATGRLNSHIEEMYTGHTLVKVYGHQQAAVETFDQENEELYDASFKAQFRSGTIQPSMGFVANLNYVIVAVVGGLKVASGTMSLGDVQAFIQYSRQFTQPITQIASMMNLLQSGVASAERVFDLLDSEEQTPDPVPAKSVDPVRGNVVFDDVSFSYDPEAPLIEHLNLEVKPGQTIAIVGPTGAGKTTLVNLIMRFYDVDSGVIRLDGVDTRDMTRSELRSDIGMVLQDTWLFSGTIEENLRYGVREGKTVTEEEFLAATKATHVDPFVRTLPEGYQTVIDDEGASVSAGEKQLLTIARAFLADPAILILDEATSSVDTRTEVLVQEAMNALRQGRTSFVIAHRLSTIRDADTILVMEHGSIVEQGSHEDLLAADGAYSRLYQSQFAAPVGEEAEEESARV